MAHRTQSQHLESIQKRALRIIFNFTRGFPYSSILFVAGWNSLEDRRHNLSRSFFSKHLRTWFLPLPLPTSPWYISHYGPPLLELDVHPFPSYNVLCKYVTSLCALSPWLLTFWPWTFTTHRASGDQTLCWFWISSACSSLVMINSVSPIFLIWVAWFLKSLTPICA